MSSLRTSLRALAGRTLERRPILRRLIRPLRFGLVGLSGVVVNTAVLWLLVHWARLGLIPASVVATEAAILNNFLLNDCWTFATASRHEPRWRRLLRFNGVALGGMLITVVVLSAVVALLPVGLVLANLVAVGAATAWNYVANSRWTWAGPR
jgi:dolichol-phosphate mannosyltransferase